METRMIALKDGDGMMRVQIPADSRLTFGPVMGGKYAGSGTYALRVYRGATEKSGLIAIFPNVEFFFEIGAIAPYREQENENGVCVWVEDDGWFEKGKGAAKRLTR